MTRTRVRARGGIAAGRFALPSPSIAVGMAASLLCLLVAVAAALSVLSRDPWPSDDGILIGLAAVFGVEGIVIAKRQPRNAIGWTFLLVAILSLADTDAKLYLVLEYRLHHRQLPLGDIAAHWVAGYTLLPLLFGLPVVLLFPDSRVPTGWRRFLRIYLVVSAVFSLLQFLGQRLPTSHQVTVNVRGVPTNISTSVVAGAAWLVSPLFIGCWGAFAAYQIGRWRRANGVQRAQLKWLAAGATICVVSSVAVVAGGDPTNGTARAVADLSTVGIGALPVSIGIGILRYRLYEIDRLVSRTLSYAVVTGLLVGIYIGLVTLATRVLPFSSPVAVASSTLAAAGLFSPLRSRVQRLVNRRFNRARYNADTTIADFRADLRDTTELALVQRRLIDVITPAIEPAHISVWIRPRT